MQSPFKIERSASSFIATLFFISMGLLLLAYLIFEFIFIPYGALSADEFVFARHIYDYTQYLPYRDFPPYKGVIGYYLLAIPFFFAQDWFSPIFAIKKEIAILNVTGMGLSLYLATKLFDKKAILITFLAILANQVYLVYGTDLRVDTLTSWLSLIAVLSLLWQRPKLSGIIMGIAFLISQKALWYWFAADGALFFCWLLINRSSFNLRYFVTFNLFALIPIALYILVWSNAAGFSAVFINLFYEGYIQAGIEWYMPIYVRCWRIVLQHGPLLFLMWPLTFISLFDETKSVKTEINLFAICFSSIVLLLFIYYRQPFPYNFVCTIPAFFMLYASFFSWLLSSQKTPVGINSKFYLFLVYSIAIIIFIWFANLPWLNYFAAIIPLSLYFYFRNIKSSLMFALSLGLFIAIGIFYPLSISIKIAELLDGRYQQTMLRTAHELLTADGSYVGGVPFLYEKDQPIDGLKNLIGPALEYLYQPTKDLEPLLLPSLYLAPTSVDKIITDFEKQPVKLLLNNYRMLTLPPKLMQFIHENYTHYRGSIYLYAPVIKPSQLSFNLKFTGKYRIKTNYKFPVTIDGKTIKNGQTKLLTKGDHTTDAKRNYRLILVPDIQVNNQYKEDEWLRMVKAILA